MQPVIEMISTGDEVLTGLIVDTNAAWLGRRLLDAGLEINRRHTVGDNLDHLSTLIQDLAERADWVIVNGGLGPTEDDLTAQAAARAKGVPLVTFPEWVSTMQERYRQRNRTMPASNLKQAELPEGVEIIDNPHGTACGFSFTFKRATFCFTPGVPSEFYSMIEEQILPRLLDNLQDWQPTTLRRFYTFGLSESWLSDQIQSQTWPDEISIGYRSDLPIIELKIVARGFSALESTLDAAQQQLFSLLDGYLIASGNRGEIAPYLHQALPPQSLCILENFTGGQLLRKLSAGDLLKYGSWLPQLPSDPQMMAQLARIQFPKMECSYLLLVSSADETGDPASVSIALVTEEAILIHRLRIGLWSTELMQRLIAMAAQDLLRRHLLGLEPFPDYQSLQSLEHQHWAL